jgi:hypothetical protein
MEWNEEKKREVEGWLAYMRMSIQERIQEYESIEDFMAKTFSNGGTFNTLWFAMHGSCD